MEAMYVVKMLVDFHQTKWHYIPENSTLQSTFMFMKNNQNCFDLLKHIPRRATESFPTHHRHSNKDANKHEAYC
jgi:hypothetical protein